MIQVSEVNAIIFHISLIFCGKLREKWGGEVEDWIFIKMNDVFKFASWHKYYSSVYRHTHKDIQIYYLKESSTFQYYENVDDPTFPPTFRISLIFHNSSTDTKNDSSTLQKLTENFDIVSADFSNFELHPPVDTPIFKVRANNTKN